MAVGSCSQKQGRRQLCRSIASCPGGEGMRACVCVCVCALLAFARLFFFEKEEE